MMLGEGRSPERLSECGTYMYIYSHCTVHVLCRAVLLCCLYNLRLHVM